MFETIRLLIICGTVLLVGFAVLLAMPKSKLRSVVMPVVGAGLAIVCGIYAISPIDVLPEAFLGPFGLIDDVGAVVLGIASARAALTANKP